MPNIIVNHTERGLLPADAEQLGKYHKWRAKYQKRRGNMPFRLNLPADQRTRRTNNAWHGDFTMLAEMFGVSPEWIKLQSKKLCKELFLVEIPERIPGHPIYDLRSSKDLTQDEADIWIKTYREHWQATANQMFSYSEIVWYEDLQRQAEYWGEY